MLKNNEVWLGYNSVKEFMQPDGSIKKFGNKLWYTNLDIQKRHEKLILWQRYYDDDGNPLPDAEERYPRYDNYMAINVDKVADIPMDYKPWIKLNDAQLRMLFLTGDGKEQGGRSPNGMQLAAIKRATNRFNDMKRRGLLDGNEHNFYVTLLNVNIISIVLS